MTASGSLVLAGDIGATKTDLGLYAADSRGSLKLLADTIFASCDAAAMVERVREFLAREGAGGEVVAGCFGVAGPVSGGRVRAVNLGLELEEGWLARALGLSTMTLVNDLYATAYALAVAEEPDEIEILQPGAAACGNGMGGVLAPGTGLGMALMQRMAKHRPPGIIASEGGHCNFAPRTADEAALWGWLRGCFGHVSRERLLSGPGLYNIYRWLKGQDPEPGCRQNAALVLTGARAGEEEALRALEIFTGIMGAVAGDLALFGLTEAGLYLAGGMPSRILPFLPREVFLEAFRDKGRLSGWLERVPVKLVLNPRTALAGAARIALAEVEKASPGR